MDNRDLAAALSAALKPDRAPVGIACVDQAPAGIAGVSNAAPSACTFWRRAEQDVFYAAAADHAECPIGMLTMGFPLDAAGQATAAETVGLFTSLEYFNPAEVAHLPSISRPHSGIVYGPLARLPIPPDVVLLVVLPSQAMLVAESDGSLELGAEPKLATLGRPACAAIPRAMASAQTTLSLGCIGARTYAEIPEDRVLLVIPAARIGPTVERLSVLSQANARLGEMHAAKKARMESDRRQ